MRNKKTYIIQIPKPCNEGWDKMTQNEKGRFCERCEKTVVDFSNKSDSEIIQLIKNSDTKICGHFRGNQINREMALNITSRNYFYPFPYLFSGFLLLAAPSCNFSKITPVDESITGEVVTCDPKIFEPEDTIKGRIVDAYTLESLKGVQIALLVNNTVVDSFKTEENGNFNFIVENTYLNQSIQLKIEKSKNYSYLEQIIKIDPEKDLPWNQEIRLKTNFVDGEIMLIEKPSKRKKKQIN